MGISRRKFIQSVGTTGVSFGLLAGSGYAVGGANNGAQPHVVVVGGGSGGATCAKYLRKFDDNIKVTLVEPKTTYHTCYASNWVLGGLRDISEIAHGYDALQDRHGVDVIHDTVTDVDPEARTVSLNNGDRLSYDRLVLSPGIDFKWDEIEGYDEEVAERLPHAWKAGPQTATLRAQLTSMPDGGVFILVAPPNPFRCPPGPYERTSLVAHYLKEHKPKSKVLVLDAKDGFSKQPLFEEGWADLYGDMVEWVPMTDGGLVTRVSADEMAVWADSGFEKIEGDVINVVPPQKAGALAHQVGLTGGDDWCEVDQRTFESTVHPGVHVIGDASIAGAMPKSGHSANNQAKMTAATIVSAFNDWSTPDPSHVNTCYSLIGPEYGISVAAVYHYADGEIQGVEGAGGISPEGATRSFRAREANFTRGWYASITRDIFG